MEKRFRSKYCSKDTFITGSQYLAELMCERSARQNGLELKDHFWKTQKWNQIFRRHIVQCNRLLKRFPIEAIIRAFHDPQTANFLSFGNKKYISIIKKHLRDLKKRDSGEITEIRTASKIEKPRQPLGKKSLLTKLKEIDGSEAD